MYVINFTYCENSKITGVSCFKFKLSDFYLIIVYTHIYIHTHALPHKHTSVYWIDKERTLVK